MKKSYTIIVKIYHYIAYKQQIFYTIFWYKRYSQNANIRLYNTIFQKMGTNRDI